MRLKLGQGAVGWTAAHREPLRIPDVTVDARYLAARPSTRSEMSVPLMAEGELLGIFNLESDRVDAFDDGDLRFLTGFGHHCAIAIQRAWLHNASLEKRRMEEEIRIARRIQLRLLPAESPALAGLRHRRLQSPLAGGERRRLRLHRADARAARHHDRRRRRARASRPGS